MDPSDNGAEDAALVARTLAGEREAFGRLVLRHYPGVLRLCARLLGSPAEAQDAAQEAALQALVGLDRLREPERFGAWFHAIAANVARSILRARRLRSAWADPDGAGATVLWSAAPPTPEEVSAAREAHDEVMAALGTLSGVNRDAVVGFYLQGYSYAELAALLNVPVSTVKGRLFKGRRQLAALLGPGTQDAGRDDGGRRKEREMRTDGLIRVDLEAIREGEFEGDRMFALIFKERDSERLLPMWVLPQQADAIAMALRGERAERPLTHDLMARLLETLGAEVARVAIDLLPPGNSGKEYGVFAAEITLRQGGGTHMVDARASDGVAVALRLGSPIYAAAAVLDAAAFRPGEHAGGEREKPAG
jgi:RNA polymerase sigma-70 factor (ECF subfamily)